LPPQDSREEKCLASQGRGIFLQWGKALRLSLVEFGGELGLSLGEELGNSPGHELGEERGNSTGLELVEMLGNELGLSLV
jgi:hypothetical protein